MPSISFFIPGLPGSKQSTIQGKTPSGEKIFYTKKKSSDYQNLVKMTAYQVMKEIPIAEGWVCMDTVVFSQIPESWSQKKKKEALAGKIKPTVKPDRDNIEKVLQDGMNNIVFRDDKQITDGAFKKRYAEKPGVQIDVYWEN